jgi:Fur family peroxide stress response transcriptional regulator
MVAIQEILREKGYKATPQRIAIYNILACTDRHPTVETIYEKVREEFPTVSLNTVYKTLLTLKEAGLVRRLDLGEDFARYDANPKPHAHIICTKCSRVDDVDVAIDRRVSGLLEHTACYSDYKVEDWDVYIYGICPSCSGEGCTEK